MTIGHLKSESYYVFDAHTTTNCCHGIATLASDLIRDCSELDFEGLEKGLNELSKAEGVLSLPEWLPDELIELTGLFLLGQVRDVTPEGRIKTHAKHLKAVYPIGVAFCWEVVNGLQRHFSNRVTDFYEGIFHEIDPRINLNGVTAKEWGQYATQPFLKNSGRDILYAACVYSTQMCLGHLAGRGSKIAFVNDLMDESGTILKRYVKVLQGDVFGFTPVDEKDLEGLDGSEPVVVFGGYTKTSRADLAELIEEMDEWVYDLPSLILAGDVFYPQFPHISNDPVFDPTPIFPTEENILATLHTHSNIKGVSYDDPSLFLSTHNYPASLGEVMASITDETCGSLPSNFSKLSISYKTPWIAKIFEVLENSLS